MRALFVCSQNKLRSPTAEDVFASWEGVEAASAGTNHDAVTPLSGDLIEWADIVFVMERDHQAKMTRKFGPLLRGKKVVCLGIPDEFERGDPELVQLLEDRAGPWMRRNAAASRSGSRR